MLYRRRNVICARLYSWARIKEVILIWEKRKSILIKFEEDIIKLITYLFCFLINYKKGRTDEGLVSGRSETRGQMHPVELGLDQN